MSRTIAGFTLLLALAIFALCGTIASLPRLQVSKDWVVCHKEEGQPHMTKRLPNQRAYNAHIAHGDSDGECAAPAPTATLVIVTFPPTAPVATPYVPPTWTPQPPPTSTPKPSPPPPTWTPQSQGVTVTDTPQPQLAPSVTITPTRWSFQPIPTAETCDLCSAQEEALRADANLKNTFADVLRALFFDNLVPDFIKELTARD